MSPRGWIALLMLCVMAGSILSPSTAVADRLDYATFEAFYGESESWSKYLWIAFVAVATAVAMVVTAGGATPAAAAVGGWIGSLMGYSGAAATNAGLALLGGGSIASGGLGVVGGAALLIAAMEFTAGVAIDATVSMIFDGDDLIATMDERPMLPLPIRGGDLPSARAAMQVLESIDRSRPMDHEGRRLVRQAIEKLKSVDDGNPSTADRAQKLTLQSSLELIAGDPKAAKRSAAAAYELSKSAGVKRTIPTALLGIAMLYDDRPDFNRSLDLFEYATKYEAGSPVGPTMYAVYFDLLTARADDIPHRYRPWDRLAKFVDQLEEEQPKAIFQSMLLARMLMRVKIEQTRILVLSGTNNCTIRRSDKTLEAVERSLEQYKWVVAAFNATVAKERTRIAAVKQSTGAMDWEKGWADGVTRMAGAMSQYVKDADRLVGIVEEFRIEQVLRRSSDLASVCWQV